jgi:hypothetical protein
MAEKKDLKVEKGTGRQLDSEQNTHFVHRKKREAVNWRLFCCMTWILAVVGFIQQAHTENRKVEVTRIGGEVDSNSVLA